MANGNITLFDDSSADAGGGPQDPSKTSGTSSPNFFSRLFGGTSGADWGRDIWGGIGGLLSGGLFGSTVPDLGPAQDFIKSQIARGQGFLSPFQQAGISSLGPLQQLLMQGEDPTALINKIQTQFTQSPAQKAQQEQALSAAKSALAAQGLSGSGLGSQDLAQTVGDVLGRQQQQYLQNVLGVRGQTLGGLGDLTRLGEGAGAQMGQFGMSGAQDIANLMAAQAQAEAEARASSAQGAGGLFGDIGSLFGSIF